MEQVGRIANQLIAQSTASQALSVERPRSLKPETLADCRAITAWAEATMPVQQAAPPARVTKRLEYLDANLPRKQQDEKGGELRTAALLATLSPFSDDALAFMVREACKRFKWFPTAKELLDILAEYVAPVSEQETALIECRRFATEAFAVWLDNIAAGQPIGDVPEQWCRIAVERGTMRRLSNGSYVTRALYQGPVKAWTPEPRLPTLPVTVEPMREAA